MRDNRFEPKVTVMTPAWNAAKYIRASIESVLKQDYTRFEIVIVDDCSEDDTLKIAREFLSDGRVRVYRNNRQRGENLTRKRILRLARGEYIVPHDADDIMLQGRLREQVKIMDSHRDVGVVFGRGVLCSEGSREIQGFFPHRNGNSILLERSGVVSEMPFDLSHCASLMRKDIIFRVGGFDNLLPVGSDLRLMKRLFDSTRFYFLNRLCFVYRKYARSASSRYIQGKRRFVKAIFSKGKLPAEKRDLLWRLNFYLDDKGDLDIPLRGLLPPGQGLFHGSLLSKEGKGVLIFTENGSRSAIIFSFLKQGFSYHSSEHGRLLIRGGAVIGKGLLDPMVLMKPLKIKGRILEEKSGQFWNPLIRRYFLNMDLFRIKAIGDECRIARILEIQLDAKARKIERVRNSGAQQGRLLARNALRLQLGENRVVNRKIIALLQRQAQGYQIRLRREDLATFPLHSIFRD